MFVAVTVSGQIWTRIIVETLNCKRNETLLIKGNKTKWQSAIAVKG